MNADLATAKTTAGNSFVAACGGSEYTNALGIEVHCCANALTQKMVCLPIVAIGGTTGSNGIDVTGTLGACDLSTTADNACADR